MACLQQSFEDWLDAEPEEPGDRPSEEELEAYERAGAKHGEMVRRLLKWLF